MPIRILPDEVASQIAAGEVIERPASVVKELVENALDAGASQISIKIKGAGQQLIEVGDDGIGIRSEELPLAVERHATSKLASAADLFRISTLGFRGEALASIGSVSRMRLTSRAEGVQVGASLRVEAGQIFSAQPAGAAVGTVVSVEDLFYNVPARLKFMKSENTERRVIDQLVTRYALAYPKVRFYLEQEGRVALQTSGNGARREVLGSLYGAQTAQSMLEVLYREQALAIEGFISPISITRSHRREILFFVNGRPVQDAALISALTKSYHTLLMVGRYPIAVLFIEMPAESLDVNVHPTKAEIRFREPERVFVSVQSAVKRALLAHNPVPGLSAGMMWTSQPPLDSEPGRPGGFWSTHLPPPGASGRPHTYLDDQGRDLGRTAGPEPVDQDVQPRLDEKLVPILRPVGQIASTYLVAEGPDGLYLIDQHAAHERVLFERLMSQLGKSIPSQALLQPVTVDLAGPLARLMDEMLPTLTRLGFEIEHFGQQTYLVRSVPAMLAEGDPAAMVRSLVEDFEEDESPLQKHTEARLIARICKRSAVKAGMALSPAEQRQILLDLEACESPRTCPHGRPTMIHLSVDLLERQFGRRGPR